MRIRFTSIFVEDQDAALRPRFVPEPVDLGPVILAVFEDGCGNLLQIAQAKPTA